MRQLLTILALCATASAYGAGYVTVKLDDVSLMGAHQNMWFDCALTIHNGTGTQFYATNLFIGRPGLALKISDLDGKELKRTYADPFINYHLNTAVIPPGDSTFKEPYGLGRSFSLPASIQTVKVRLEGTLSNTGYTNRLVSNVVQVHVP